MTNDANLEEMMSHLGEFGKYQLFQFLLHIIAGLTAGIHMVSLVTIAAIPEFQCIKAGSNLTISETIVPSTCALLDTESNKTYDCNQWTYNTTYYQSSVGMDWNFVCSNKWKGPVAKSVYMFGVLAGAATLGSMADKYGRKIIFCVSGTAQLIIGLIVALIGAYGEYYTWVIARFFFGIFGSAGAYIPGFVLTMEMVGASKRTACGILFQMTFTLGIVLVAFWGSLIKDSMWLQITYALHAILLLPHWWIMDESPRWLWAQGRCKEAFKIVKRALDLNGNDVRLDSAKYLKNKETKQTICDNNNDDKTYTATDLLKTPNLRKKFLNVCLNWIACAVGYYGITLSSANESGDPFWNLALNALVEFPSYFFIIFTMDKLGRRFLSSSCLLIGGVCCIAVVFISTEIISTVVILVGKACIALSFAVIYNYTAELFPTVLRNTSVGIGSMCCRFGGALTPLLLLLDNKSIPSIVFGAIALLSGFLTLFLPETAGQPMPETLEDGEEFGIGDNCFTTCLGKRKKVDN